MARNIVLALLASVLFAGVAAAQVDRGQDLRADLQRVEAMERAGQLDQARAELETMLERTPAQPAVILAYERVIRRLGRLEDALPAVLRAVELDSTSAILRQTQLRLLSDLGMIRELERAGARWIDQDPELLVAYQDFAMALRRVGELRKAERVLVQGQGRTGRPGALAAELADIYLDQARWSAAAAQWIGIIEESPGMGWDLVTYRIDSLGPLAERASSAILEWLPEHPKTEGERRLTIIASIYAGEPGTARDVADELMETMEPDQRRQFVGQFSRLAAGREQPALVAWAYRFLLHDIPDDSLRWDLAQQVVHHDLSAGDTASALSTLDRFVDAAEPGSPQHRWASGLWIRVVAANGDADDAERTLEEYLALYPADRELPALALSVAEGKVRDGRLEDAARVLDLVPAVGGSSAAGRIAAIRGYLALYDGEYDAARADFDRAATTLRGAQRSEALRFLGFLRNANERELQAVAAAHRAARQEKWSEAFDAMLDGLQDSPPSAARPALLLWTGELGIRAGSVKKAELALRRIPERYPESGEAPVALMDLAEALARADRKSDAIELLETLILDYPDSALTPIGRRRLAELKEEVPKS